jgi:hypothetical protein
MTGKAIHALAVALLAPVVSLLTAPAAQCASENHRPLGSSK